MFEIDVSDEQMRAEREKARSLRKQSWWKNRVAQGVCHYCAQQVPPKELTLDHVVPLARGGRSSKNNCVPACKSCNTKKRDLLPMEWQEYLENFSP